MSVQTLRGIASAVLILAGCHAAPRGATAVRGGELDDGATVGGGAAGAVEGDAAARAPRDARSDGVADGVADGSNREAPPDATVLGPIKETVEDPPSGALTFRSACRPTTTMPGPEPGAWASASGSEDVPRDRIILGALGDVLLHVELQKQGLASQEGFTVLWSSVTDLLSRPDLTYANLESPLAAGVGRDGEELGDPGRVYDGKVYTSYPRFNVHPSLASALVKSGVDVVSTANNHAMDRGPLGVDRTVTALSRAKLAATGTRARDRLDAPWHTVVKAEGYRVAFIACTRHVNGREDPGAQVLRCDRQGKELLSLIRKLASNPKIDAVVVTPHWGDEYSHEPNAQQRKWAAQWVEAGASVVIGNHPHVLQPWERLVSSDGREALVIYSLGNFASHQQDLAKRSSVLALIELRPGQEGRLEVSGAGYVPLTVRQTGSSFFVESVERAASPAEILEHITSILGSGNALPADGSWEMPSDCGG